MGDLEVFEPVNLSYGAEQVGDLRCVLQSLEEPLESNAGFSLDHRANCAQALAALGIESCQVETSAQAVSRCLVPHPCLDIPHAPTPFCRRLPPAV